MCEREREKQSVLLITVRVVFPVVLAAWQYSASGSAVRDTLKYFV